VSSIDQDLDIQISKLKAEGCEIVRSEKISGGSREARVELETVIQFYGLVMNSWSRVWTGLVATLVTFSTSSMNASNDKHCDRA
jgi:hypothetical protein